MAPKDAPPSDTAHELVIAAMPSAHPRDYAPPPLEWLGPLFAAAYERCRPPANQAYLGCWPVEWWGALAREISDLCQEAAECEFGFVQGRPEVANDNPAAASA